MSDLQPMVARLGDEVGVFVPLGACRASLAYMEAACEVLAREYGRSWSPKPDAGEFMRLLRRAHLVVDVAGLPSASPEGSAPEPTDQGGLMSTAEVADVLGVSRRRVGQLVDAGAFPGARRIGRHWAIPEHEVC